ncbi:MAG: type II CRISPR RNA-guided endonuclease Cas9, partial [Pyrinomonadaceae bacterium]
KITLGLDLGVTSVGWALIKTQLNPELDVVARDADGAILNGEIVASGVRIFPATTDGAKSEPKNSKRRNARGQRRLVMRKAKRRNELRGLLSQHGLLPEITSAASAEEFQKIGDPYTLRVRSLREKVEPFEVGRSIYHLAKRRGFLSNRKTAKSEENGVVYDGIKRIREELEAGQFRTLGELLNTKEKKRKHFTHRTMAESEFDEIWNTQKTFHPELLTDELRSKIRNIIFYQRPMKLQRNLIGKCSFETDKKRCDLARQEAQRIRYWQDLNNLQLQDPETLNWRTLTLAEKEKIADKFENTKELTYKGLRKLLKIGADVRINLEANEKKLYGNRTAFAFRKALGDKWDNFNDEEQSRLTEELFRIENEVALKRRLETFWEFNADEVEQLEGVWHQLEDGYSRLSLKAIRKVLPLMKEGKRYDEAVREIYGDHRKQFGKEEFQKLELPPRDLRNPIVFKALCEVRKVVNAIIREYGRPDEIRIEMARDLKLTHKQKDAAMKQANLNKKANEEAEVFFKEKFGLENVSGTDKLKYRLWKESGERCPYTGNPIPPETLLDDGLVDIEHIIPYSRCFDDSYMNKTICDAKFNREVKRNLAPGEIYDRESEKYLHLMQRVSSLPFGKQRKFKLTPAKLQNLDWAGRQLSDTRYICREVRGYLRQLYPYSPDENKYVQVVAGGATANLRHVWHVNAILSDGDIEYKNRWDHRHHAIDAIVVALCDRGLYQLISKLSGKNKDLMKRILSGFSEPWRGFLDDVNDSVQSIIISHAPTRRKRGQLLEETAYGSTNTPGVYVTKKSVGSLTAAKIKNIVDPTIKEIVELRVSQFNGDLKKAFVDPLLHKDGRTEIRNVRVFVTMSPETVVGVKDERGKEYKYYPLAGNHHVDIYEDVDSERKAVLVPRFYANQRNRQSADLGPEWHKLFSLCANDYIEFRGDDGELEVYRIQKMSGGGRTRIDIRPLEDARTDYIPGKTFALTSSDGLKRITRKLQVDPLGRLTQAGD